MSSMHQGLKDDLVSQELKKKTKAMRVKMMKMCDLFDKVIDFNHNPTSESAKRKLDMEIERLKVLQEQLEKEPPKIDDMDSSVDTQSYDKFYVQYMKGIAGGVDQLRADLIQHLVDKTSAEQLLSKENMTLKLDFQREQAESMHQRQNHEYAVTEKNTVLATCRKLGEQLEDRSKQIQQLQREGTVSLWQREKAKLMKDLNSNEARLEVELKEAQEQLEETKSRLQQRLAESMEQVKYLKMEREVKNGATKLHGGDQQKTTRKSCETSTTQFPSPKRGNLIRGKTSPYKLASAASYLLEYKQLERHNQQNSRQNELEFLGSAEKKVKDLDLAVHTELKLLGMEGGHVPPSEVERLKQQLFLKDRALVVAEGEIQKQQKYFVGFLGGLSRDFRIMLERQHLTVKEYNRDQKAFASMLNKMYASTKDGLLTDFRATLPSHYLGINVDLSGHPLGKKLSRPFEDLEKHLKEVEDTEFRVDVNHPLLTGWREGRSPSTINRKVSKAKSAQVTGVHPQLVDMLNKKVNVTEAVQHFPELTEQEIKDMFQQFMTFDANKDCHLDNQELLRAIPDTLGRMATTEEIKEAMLEVDIDDSGTVDFYEFLCVARLVTQGGGEATLFKKKTLKALQKPMSGNVSKTCVVQ